MQMQEESGQTTSITHYTESQIFIQGHVQSTPFLLSEETGVFSLPMSGLSELTESSFQTLSLEKLELILFEHPKPWEPLPSDLQALLAKYRLSYEVMPLGAACRTYNLLISDKRSVAAAFFLR